MKFTILYGDQGKELQVTGNNFTITTSISNESESLSLATSLLEAANDLLLDTDFNPQTEQVTTIINTLNGF